MSEPNEVELYLEAHVTIEPVFDAERTRASLIAKAHGFKLAHLLMQKERKATAERSSRDTFMTGHSKFCDDITARTKALVVDLQNNGFKVWRYKIENTMLDSHNVDVWDLVDRAAPPQPASMCDACRRA
jgi:hypothetical protein